MKNLPLAKLSALIAGCAALALVKGLVQSVTLLQVLKRAVAGLAGTTLVFFGLLSPGTSSNQPHH
jgi:hypothetical protein